MCVRVERIVLARGRLPSEWAKRRERNERHESSFVNVSLHPDARMNVCVYTAT